jgi:hypothetical protein
MQRAAEILDALEDPEWVVRRKESLELLSERHVRHRVSVDFERRHDRSSYPLFFLRKAAGQFTRFDFHDEADRRLPLPTREENVRVSTEVLVEAARRVLQAASPPLPVTERLETELAFIARSELNDSLAILRYGWPRPDGAARLRTSPWWRRGTESRRSAFARNKVVLMADPFFSWLIRTLAYSCVVVVEVPATSAPRRILKLGYDEAVTDFSSSRGRGAWGAFTRSVGRVFYRLGWRGYQYDALFPYAGARSFHVEFYAPDGAEILEAGLRESPHTRVRGPRSRVHLYLSDARQTRSVTTFVQMRVRGMGFTSAAVASSMAIALVVAACGRLADELTGQPIGPAPSVLLLFPGVVATFLARAEHPLVARLLRFARVTLLASALCAYLAAARLALVTRTTSAESLRGFFEPLTWAAGACAVVLLLSSVLPLPLSHWARAPFRRLARRRSSSEDR